MATAKWTELRLVGAEVRELPRGWVLRPLQAGPGWILLPVQDVGSVKGPGSSKICLKLFGSRRIV